MSYSFKESTFGPDFAKDKLKDFKTLIDRSISFVAMSMPGTGASYFLRYLATRDFAFFVHVDLYSLPALTKHEFFKLLLFELGGKPANKSDEQLLQEAKAILKKLSEKHDKIVIIFSRFDQLKKEFDVRFLSNIQSLTTVTHGKIVEIFTSIKPLTEIAPEALTGGNLNFYSENLYFKPYSISDLKTLLTIEPGRLTTQENLDRLLELSGGHNQLLHILLSSQKEQLLLDQFVKLQLKELVDYLDYTQRKQIQKIALGKKVTSQVTSHPERSEGSIDDYLLGVGMVKEKDSGYELFTPLLSDYIKQNMPIKLPPKEAKLFRLLRNSSGQVVSKDEIFNEVWGPADAGSEATDWALDALIYRLRKHPFIQAHGYIIESHKKVGYSLIQT